MSVPTTMFRLTGRDYPPAKLSHASLIIIDAQKEYLSGPLQLSGMDEAVANIARLLDAARKSGRPIIMFATWHSRWPLRSTGACRPVHSGAGAAGR